MPAASLVLFGIFGILSVVASVAIHRGVLPRRSWYPLAHETLAGLFGVWLGRLVWRATLRGLFVAGPMVVGLLAPLAIQGLVLARWVPLDAEVELRLSFLFLGWFAVVIFVAVTGRPDVLVPRHLRRLPTSPDEVASRVDRNLEDGDPSRSPIAAFLAMTFTS